MDVTHTLSLSLWNELWQVLAKLLDKFDPKSDGADRSYADIYDESAKLLYEEIDYTLEGENAQRFKQSFDEIGIDYIRVPNVYWEASLSSLKAFEVAVAYPSLSNRPVLNRPASR